MKSFEIQQNSEKLEDSFKSGIWATKTGILIFLGDVTRQCDW